MLEPMIYVLTGPNTFMRTQRKRELVNNFIATHSDLAYERFDCENQEADTIRGALESLPFLASKKLVVLDQPSGNKILTEKIKDWLSDLPDTTDVIIVEPKFDKRSSYYKFAKKLDGYEEFAELEMPALIKWIVAYAKQQKAHIENNVARGLIARVGADQQKLSMELTKLSLYSSDIDSKAVEALTVATPSSTIFELLEATFSGNRRRAMELYDEQRELQVDPMQIIAMLTWQFHVFALIKAAGNKSPREIASEAKLNPYVVQKSASALKGRSLQDIATRVHELRLLDEKLKSSRVDSDEALRAFLISI